MGVYFDAHCFEVPGLARRIIFCIWKKFEVNKYELGKKSKGSKTKIRCTICTQ